MLNLKAELVELKLCPLDLEEKGESLLLDETKA